MGDESGWCTCRPKFGQSGGFDTTGCPVHGNREREQHKADEEHWQTTVGDAPEARIMARQITFDAGREPMFQDEHGNGWVPIAKWDEREDVLRNMAQVAINRGGIYGDQLLAISDLLVGELADDPLGAELAAKVSAA